MLIDGRQMHIQITKGRYRAGTSFCPVTRRGARRSRNISMTRSRSLTTASNYALWTGSLDGVPIASMLDRHRRPVRYIAMEEHGRCGGADVHPCRHVRRHYGQR